MNLSFLVMIVMIGIITHLLITPNADPYNLKRIITITGTNSYNMMKYNAVIMLKEILKHTSQYLNDDIKQWINKKNSSGYKVRLLGHFEYYDKFILLLFI
jgi:hypothetical protein